MKDNQLVILKLVLQTGSCKSPMVLVTYEEVGDHHSKEGREKNINPKCFLTRCTVHNCPSVLYFYCTPTIHPSGCIFIGISSIFFHIYMKLPLLVSFFERSFKKNRNHMRKNREQVEVVGERTLSMRS